MASEPRDLEEIRAERRRARLADRVKQARSLRDVSPEETLQAAFDLTRFAATLNQVGS